MTRRHDGSWSKIAHADARRKSVWSAAAGLRDVSLRALPRALLATASQPSGRIAPRNVTGRPLHRAAAMLTLTSIGCLVVISTMPRA
jgi:hypothetical protein